MINLLDIFIQTITFCLAGFTGLILLGIVSKGLEMLFRDLKRYIFLILLSQFKKHTKILDVFCFEDNKDTWDIRAEKIRNNW